MPDGDQRDVSERRRVCLARRSSGQIGCRRRVVAIVPHEMAIASEPELDETGNSLAGVAVLEKLTQRLGRSVY